MFSKSEMISIMNAAAQKIEELGGSNEIADDLYEVVSQLEQEDWKDELAAEDAENE